jgi:type II secretory pathway pseudopilin PulG
MLTRARAEAGVSLVELLVVVGLLSVVLLALFSTLNGFGRATSANFAQNEAQSTARTAIDRLARELRNTGSPGLPDVPIERADPDELVFNTTDPLEPSGGAANATSVVRVRYCQHGNSGRLWRQVQTWTTSTRPPLPPREACPHNSYGTRELVADDVINEESARAVFTYDSASLSQIGTVTVELSVDTDRDRAPGAQRLSTTVSLRNQNRPPTATFTATLTGSRHVLLNASGSSDPDGDELSFTWYDGSTFIGTGPLLDYGSPSTGPRTFSVTVTDAGGLQSIAPPQTIAVS